MSKAKKLVVPVSRPRNVVAVQAQRSGAGSHRKSEKVYRRDSKVALKSGRDFFQASMLYFGLSEVA